MQSLQMAICQRNLAFLVCHLSEANLLTPAASVFCIFYLAWLLKLEIATPVVAHYSFMMSAQWSHIKDILLFVITQLFQIYTLGLSFYIYLYIYVPINHLFSLPFITFIFFITVKASLSFFHSFIHSLINLVFIVLLGIKYWI